jgi:SET domain-containing protein
MFFLPQNFWEIRNTGKKGRGVFCLNEIKAKTIIGEYTGIKIKIEEYDLEKDKDGLYLMFLNDKYAIYPDLEIDDIHLINHSCNPNCWIFNTGKHIYFFALRDIKIGEELTVSYLLPPIGECKPCNHNCFCESDNCSGTMHQTENQYNRWQKFQETFIPQE